MATINGHFDLATMLLERGADPEPGGRERRRRRSTPRSTCSGRRAPAIRSRARTSTSSIGYLEYMKALLDKGADPNARVSKKVWYSSYNFDLSGVDETGATPFWRAAYAADVEAMKLLCRYGADPNIPTVKPPERGEFGDAGRARDRRRVGRAAGAGGRPRRAAAAGRRRRRLRRGLRRQLAPLRAGRPAGRR